MTTSAPQARDDRPGWHVLSADAAVERLGVDLSRGLSSGDAQRRLDQQGPNLLQEESARPLLSRVLALLVEPMTVVLLAAAAVSALVSRELETPIAILVVVAFNTTLNLLQERRAESSLQALRQMTVAQARVRRDGLVGLVDTADLVSGDVVLLEAGDVVPADGRLLQ